MDIKKIVESTELFLFDLDGTLYLGNDLFPFTKSLLNAIKRAGKRYLFLTNNSSKGKADYVKKLNNMGVPAAEEDFLTSTEATIHYIKNTCPSKRFFLLGTRSLREALLEGGILLADEEEAEGVLSGFDTELTFQKLESACRILTKNKDALYIATNPDIVCPTEWGSVPDCGSISEIIFNATGRRPKFIGKPEPLMIELAARSCGINIENTALIGDRIYTDICSALNAGAAGILVLSGETTQEILDASPDKPTLTLKDAGEILKYL